jgi:hypothetical protein
LVQYREMRRLIVELVLLTDNDMHFSLLNRLDRSVTVHSSPDAAVLGDASALPLPPPTSREHESDLHTRQHSLASRTFATHPTTDERQLLLLQVALHCADVSNTAKPWNLYGKWLERITEEFYLQGDLERSMNMPVSYAFDRFNPVTQSKFQLVRLTPNVHSSYCFVLPSCMQQVTLCLMSNTQGFIKAIVGPLYKTFSKVDGVDISECMEFLRINARNWKEMAADEDAERDHAARADSAKTPG